MVNDCSICEGKRRCIYNLLAFHKFDSNYNVLDEEKKSIIKSKIDKILNFIRKEARK